MHNVLLPRRVAGSSNRVKSLRHLGMYYNTRFKPCCHECRPTRLNFASITSCTHFAMPRSDGVAAAEDQRQTFHLGLRSACMVVAPRMASPLASTRGRVLVKNAEMPGSKTQATSKRRSRENVILTAFSHCCHRARPSHAANSTSFCTLKQQRTFTSTADDKRTQKAPQRACNAEETLRLLLLKMQLLKSTL